ncbi:protein phosphatase 1H [Electrophorus electricus]|uniref:PPM-type phosphatase domain-containing protein n=1 Tax=Electrophorus electricus TaxID=8005 RepID=A0A4W4GTJ5_ELEEL|nr:protein phosphatase 1H [Electrophorus electricus]
MFTRVRSAVSNIIGGIMASSSNEENYSGPDLPLRFPYSRPDFLGMSPDEVECSADHIARPILIVKETNRLPWSTGYAEVINAGKSALNEDQACCEVVELRRRPADPSSPSYVPPTRRRSSLPSRDALEARERTLPTVESSEQEELYFHYWALFDGHAGSGAAVFASKLLHLHIEEQLQGVLEILQKPSLQPPTCLGEENSHHLHPSGGSSQRALSRVASLRGAAGAPGSPNTVAPRFFMEKKVKQESLVIGAIENAFKEMDKHIGRERNVYDISGGCTALVVVCLLGTLYVANAGDSRAIILHGGEIISMSSAFTPESERQRLQCLAFTEPHLLGNEFTHLEFPRMVYKKEVGKRILYRDYSMKGWAYKTVQEDDLKFPLVFGEGKKARVMATIGVTRGFGDHDLKVHGTDISIKPFLSSCPEVKVYNLGQFEHGADDVMVLATDGLWDVLSNLEVAEAVTSFLGNCDPDDHHRYTMAAQDLVMKARGVLNDRGWRIANDRLGSGDDISVYIIPLMFGNKQQQPR